MKLVELPSKVQLVEEEGEGGGRRRDNILIFLAGPHREITLAVDKLRSQNAF